MSSCRLQKDEFMKILSWLPVKDITRCKAVLKDWNQLITNSYLCNYTFKGGAWTTVLTCEAISAVFPDGRCVNSTLCWLTCPRFFRGDPRTIFKVKKLRIFSYDLKNKTCRYFVYA
ncbi:hypothetical protein DEO72_LG9g600 [Vigna unguiculata]|uniref:F-box domain-containing protein n=1 Tax=Vigna unguiculata TaxID=3917 RepID=A0A4D6MVU6_VIGUN|nr:hypothetical protein DEO72_LG9g600 [Vigna unguiculata]